MRAVDNAIAWQYAEGLLTARGSDCEKREANRLVSFLGGKATDNLISLAKDIQDRGVSAMGFSVGPKLDDPAKSIQHACRLRSADWSEWRIVLLIDEAQKISKSAPTAAPGTLSSIHQDLAGAAISFCAFGLPGTWNALAEAGVSRTSVAYDLPLAALETHECRMAVRRCFERFDVRDADTWAEAIIIRSGNWPQHLIAYLNGMLTALKPQAAEDAVGSVREASLRNAVAFGDRGREAFYARRIEGMARENVLFEEYAMHVARWLREAGGPLKAVEITRRLMSAYGVSAEEATRFWRAAEHGGLLAVGRDRTCSTPIPSFIGHLLGESLPKIADTDPATGC